MSAKEKADELVQKYKTIDVTVLGCGKESNPCVISDKMLNNSSVRCAIIAVEELIEAFIQLSIEESGRVNIDFGHGYWQDVLTELKSRL